MPRFLLPLLSLCAFLATSSSVQAQAAASPLSGEVTDLVLKGKSVEVRYRNTGAQPTAILGELQVRSEDDSLLMALPLVEERVVKAGKEEKLRVPMPVLPRGRYVLYAVVSYGGDTLTAAQAALEVR